MNYLVSLPQNTIDIFHTFTEKPEGEWFVTSDPAGCNVGSGGGTSWLLSQAWKKTASDQSFTDWLSKEKRILIHGGGQSRRLPSYASAGKLLLPVPVYRWERGQRLNQTLIDLQLPLLEKLIDLAPTSSHTMIASGDALIRCDTPPSHLPDVDIISFGLSVDPSLASRHGVFICSRAKPESLEYMLQKPSTALLRDLAVENLFYIDLGIWILSDRAVEVLMKKCGWDRTKEKYNEGQPNLYDFYGTFGLSLGTHPSEPDPEIVALTTRIINLPAGEFYHFGTSREIISSSLALQNKVSDQRAIWSRNVKPHPAMFIQNSRVDCALSEQHSTLWIENSHVSAGWLLEGEQLVTGVPENSWNLHLPRGICLDIAPIGSSEYVIRPYGIDDSFRGPLHSPDTLWMNQSLSNWLEERNISSKDTGFSDDSDLFEIPLFPVIQLDDDTEPLIQWMITGERKGRDHWLQAKRLSALEIAKHANLRSLEKQRNYFRYLNWQQLAKNYKRSVFYQIDLNHAAREFALAHIPLPAPLPQNEEPLIQIHDHMFRSRVHRYRGEDHIYHKSRAFQILQERILQPIRETKVTPTCTVFADQIVWSRSPVRIDLAGGWTDTPPYSVLSGGAVVNISLELNGQPPLQAFIRPTNEKSITLRSIDLGEREVIHSYEELFLYNQVGSTFAIPKAALCLSGFHPDFCGESYPDLSNQLKALGTGLEISFLSAVPKGSGMGTSSILSATILGALSDFCNLGWDSFEICNRTLGLEQLLTTGGGWQDQYGGVFPGVKLLETTSGWNQIPRLRWLPDNIFTDPASQASMLLYYTGITRVAKNLLAEIVEGMFLNEQEKLTVLKDMKHHALDTWEAIQLGNYTNYGEKIAKTWNQKNQLDADTSNPAIESIIRKIDDLSLGYKLPGAGGGGFLYICAKDPQAASIIKKRLLEEPTNPRSRFVDMKISRSGLQISRS